jgi:glycerate-2-kinase
MTRGVDFLKSQVANSVAQHRAFVQSLEDHENQATDTRFRDVCTRFIPKAREHQRMLEEYQRSLGASDESLAKQAEGLAKKAAGIALGMARDLADVVREDDFLKLAGDIVMSRQSEDTFKTFREGGRSLQLQQLANIGEIGERHHDEFNKEANRLIQQMFVERIQGAEATIRSSEQPRSQP